MCPSNHHALFTVCQELCWALEVQRQATKIRFLPSLITHIFIYCLEVISQSLHVYIPNPPTKLDWLDTLP